MKAKIEFKNKAITQEVCCGYELQKVHEFYPELPLKFGCRRGDCAVCAIRVLEGNHHLTKQTKEETATLARKGLSDGYRLACQCAINGNIVIE